MWITCSGSSPSTGTPFTSTNLSPAYSNPKIKKQKTKKKPSAIHSNCVSFSLFVVRAEIHLLPLPFFDKLSPMKHYASLNELVSKVTPCPAFALVQLTTFFPTFLKVI